MGVIWPVSPLGKKPGTHCTGGWVGLGAGLEACGKSTFHQVSNPEQSNHQILAITITLSRPRYIPNTREKRFLNLLKIWEYSNRPSLLSFVS